MTGRALAAHGVLVFAPDYRNCPQCDVHGMASDVDLSIGWCLEKCEEYGGDRDNVVLVGQSAGAHLCALVLLRGAVHWRPTDLRGFVGISGPYHVPATAAHCARARLRAGHVGFHLRGRGGHAPRVPFISRGARRGSRAAPDAFVARHGGQERDGPVDARLRGGAGGPGRRRTYKAPTRAGRTRTRSSSGPSRATSACTGICWRPYQNGATGPWLLFRTRRRALGACARRC